MWRWGAWLGRGEDVVEFGLGVGEVGRRNVEVGMARAGVPGAGSAVPLRMIERQASVEVP